MDIYANQEALEGTVTTTTTLTLVRKSRTIEIINDSATRNLEYKFNTAENYATLLPNEAMSMSLITREIYLQSPDSVSVAYRIRVAG